AGPGAAEVGDPGWHRDPRSRQDDSSLGLANEAGENVGGASYRPDHFGARLPRKAPMPSLASSVAKTAAKPAFSASMPSSRSPAAETSLIFSTATGAWPASLRAHDSAVSNSSWSRTIRLTR